jgi:hypothetical protein
MKKGGEKAMNMSKKTEVLQWPNESPSQFYESVRPSACAPLLIQRWLKTRR